MDDERLFEDWGLCSAFIIQDWTASSSFSLTKRDGASRFARGGTGRRIRPGERVFFYRLF